MKPLEVEWLEEAALDDTLRREWSALIEQCQEASLFQTPEWTLNWWQHLGEGTLRVLTVRRDGRLVGLASLMERVESFHGLRLRTLRFVGDPEADHCGLLSDDHDEGALSATVDAVCEAAREVDVVRLSEIGAGSAVDAAFKVRATRTLRQVCGCAPVLELEGTLEELEGSYSKTLRTRLRRARNRQKKLGALLFERWQPKAEEVPQLFEKLRTIEALKVDERAARGEPINGLLTTPARWSFMLDASAEFAGRGWLDVATLEKEGRLIAYRLGFRFRGAFLDYNLAHDSEFAALSPGRVLLDEIVRDSHQLGMQSVDASRGSLVNPHLLSDWPSSPRWHVRWILLGSSIKGRTLGLIERGLKPALRKLRGQPAPPEPN